MLEGLMNILDGLCMAGITAIKQCLDAYGTIFYGITGAISKLGNLGKGVALGGAIAVGGYVAVGTAAQQPAGPLLGRATTPVTTQTPWSTDKDVTTLTGSLPGAQGDNAWTDEVRVSRPVDAIDTTVTTQNAATGATKAI